MGVECVGVGGECVGMCGVCVGVCGVCEGCVPQLLLFQSSSYLMHHLSFFFYCSSNLFIHLHLVTVLQSSHSKMKEFVQRLQEVVRPSD